MTGWMIAPPAMAMTTVHGTATSVPVTGKDARASRRPPAVSLDTGLQQALATLARTPHLLVACDYDGTLAPVTGDPWSVWPLP